MHNKFVCLVLAAFACGAFGMAQEFRASVTGQITDPTGAGVANAKVTVQNLQTNESQTQMTSESGNYTVSFLIPGSYKVTAEAPGFQTALRPLVELHTNDKLTVDLPLQLGQSQSMVEVTGAAPLLD